MKADINNDVVTALNSSTMIYNRFLLFFFLFSPSFFLLLFQRCLQNCIQFCNCIANWPISSTFIILSYTLLYISTNSWENWKKILLPALMMTSHTDTISQQGPGRRIATTKKLSLWIIFLFSYSLRKATFVVSIKLL